MWVEYEKRGVKSSYYTYKNDTLQGLYQRFDKKLNNYVIEDGYYVHDKREGEWNIYGFDTIKTPTISLVYKGDKLIKEITHIKFAFLPWNMKNYMKGKITDSDTTKIENIQTEIVIDVDGKVKDFRIISNLTNELRSTIMEALAGMPKFTPKCMTDKLLKQNINLFYPGRCCTTELGTLISLH